jgi:cytochrome c oxidase subunit 2
MSRIRPIGKLTIVVFALALLASPVAAQSIGRSVIDDLNRQLLYVALPLALFVEVTLIYAIYRFRNNDDPSPTVSDPALEVTWTAATGVILVFVGISAFFVLANPYLSPTAAAETGETDMRVEVTAYQWGWEFHYPEANVTTQTQLVIPADRDVRLILDSEDVIHSLYVPSLGLKQDIFPGNTQIERTNATRPGRYDLYCAEFCGAGHSRMHGTVVVLNQSDYQSWLANRSAAGT